MRKDGINIEVVRSFKKGESKAFELLYNTFHKRLYGFIYSLSHSHSDSEEVLQQTFIRIWEKRMLINENFPFESILFKVAKNVFLNYSRKKINERISDTRLELYHELLNEDADDYLMLKETSAVIEALISAMPSRRQEIFRMQKMDGKSRKEISEALNISLVTIDSHLAKANQDLREGLRKFNILAFAIFHKE